MGKHTKFVYDENDDVEVDVPQGPASTSTAAGGWAPLPLSLNINQRKNKIRPKPIVAPVKGVICTSTLPHGIVQMLRHFKCDGVKSVDVRGGECFITFSTVDQAKEVITKLDKKRVEVSKDDNGVIFFTEVFGEEEGRKLMAR